MGYSLGVLTWCSVVAAEIGSGVAPEASLGLPVLGYAVCCVADEHAEPLDRCFRFLLAITGIWGGFEVFLTGLNAVTSPLLPET